MILRTTARDCLYLNWAVPARLLPDLPEPLRYELHGVAGAEIGFASALLFHHDRLRWKALPFARFSYPQLNLRYYVQDGDGQPAVFFRCMLVPAWVAPMARWIGRQPARPGALEFAHPSREPQAPSWSWRAAGGGRLALSAVRGAPRAAPAPDLGAWDDMVRYFGDRRVGYSRGTTGLRRIETTQQRGATWPLRVELEEWGLVRRGLRLGNGDGPGRDVGAPVLHSSWLCPEMPMTFALAPVHAGEEPVRRRVPAPG